MAGGFHIAKYLRSLSLLDHQWSSMSHFKKIQAHLITSGSISDSLVTEKFLYSYPEHAYTLFQSIPHPSTYIYNTTISLFHDNPGESHQALSLFKGIFSYGYLPTNHAFAFVLSACTSLREVEFGLECHCQAIKLGWERCNIVQSCLISWYVACNRLDCGSRLFDSELSCDAFTSNAVIEGYVKSKQVTLARELFNNMANKNNMTWNIMINGYVETFWLNEAIDLFRDMLHYGFQPNHNTLANVIFACGVNRRLDLCRWIHEYADTNTGLDSTLKLELMYMYMSWEDTNSVVRLFENLQSRNVFDYTSLFSYLHKSSERKYVFTLLTRMMKEGIKPTGYILTCVLNVCSTTELPKKGLRVFETMTNVYGIKPYLGYGPLIDLLCRFNMLEEAKKVVIEMPTKPDSYVLSRLLIWCRYYGKKSYRKMVKELTKRGVDLTEVQDLSKWRGIHYPSDFLPWSSWFWWDG